MDVGPWIRAARRTRRLSQRELAARVGVPASTVSRAEAGKGAPRLETFLQLIGATGFGFVLVDRRGRLLRLDLEHERFRDAGLRHLPAHLDWSGEPDYIDGPNWWGWHHIAFWPSRENVPAHVYWHRRRLERVGDDPDLPTRELGRVWDDAT